MRKMAFALVLGIVLAGCNKQVFDFRLRFEKALIRMPDGTVERIDVGKWNDYEDSDCVQIIDKNGNVYLTHYMNVVLIHEAKK